MYLLLSALPVLAVIAGLLLGLRSLHAALLGVVLALAGCVLAFPLTAQAALQAVTGWMPVLVEVLLIVGGGLLLSEVLRAAGAQKAYSAVSSLASYDRVGEIGPLLRPGS